MYSCGGHPDQKATTPNKHAAANASFFCSGGAAFLFWHFSFAPRAFSVPSLSLGSLGVATRSPRMSG